jgi:hypothetical protein
MKKKDITIIVLLLIALSVIGFKFFKEHNSQSQSTNNSSLGFAVQSAFADIDSDMIIEDKPSEDKDKTADYVFVTFTSKVANVKNNDASNPFNIKNYKLDNSPLPKGSVIASKDDLLLTIKLPNGYLKGVNSPHTLTISKDLKNKNGQGIQGPLKLDLPYSLDSLDSGSSKQTSTSNNASSNTTTAKSSSMTSANSAKNTASNADIPKYTLKIITTIPQTTVIAVTLDSPTPENYKVTVAGTPLTLKKNDKGDKIFVGIINMSYGFDEVKKLIKIEKVK